MCRRPSASAALASGRAVRRAGSLIIGNLTRSTIKHTRGDIRAHRSHLEERTPRIVTAQAARPRSFSLAQEPPDRRPRHLHGRACTETWLADHVRLVRGRAIPAVVSDSLAHRLTEKKKKRNSPQGGRASGPGRVDASRAPRRARSAPPRRWRIRGICWPPELLSGPSQQPPTRARAGAGARARRARGGIQYARTPPSRRPLRSPVCGHRQSAGPFHGAPSHSPAAPTRPPRSKRAVLARPADRAHSDRAPAAAS